MKKGILKTIPQNKNDGTIKWDEKAIEEYDKTRGQCQKITEPKTPYCYENGEAPEEDSHSHEEEKTGTMIINDKTINPGNPSLQKRTSDEQKKKLDLEELNQKLHEQALQMGIQRKDLQDSDEEEAQNRKKQADFKKKRAAHYNEFQHVKTIKKEKKNYPEPEVEEEEK